MQVLAGPLRRVRRGVALARQRTRRQVAADLRSDRYLKYVLFLAAAFALFWIWHRLPNFATRDERWRVLDPVETLAALTEEVSFGSLQDGTTYWRSYGATWYLFGAALVPVFAYTFLTGQSDVFVAAGRHQGVGYWEHWQRVPAWFWTSTVLVARLVVVAFAVGCVYLTYRIGTAVADRDVGRLAALFLALTWGFVVLTHEVGEDVPALFFFLLAFYLVVRYVDTGERATFYAASLTGGVAIAVKLTAGVIVVVIAAGFVSRALRTDDPLRKALAKPRLLAAGATIGAVTILAGYPSVLVGGPELLVNRIDRGASNKSALTHGWRVQPGWWWILRGYLHGLGLPLALGALGGLAATVPRLRERSFTAVGLRLAALTTSTLLGVFARWGYVRTHHLLPTFPLLAVVLAVALVELRDRHRTAGRVLAAALVVSTAVYAGVGTAGYASQPRDQASDWLASNAGENATLETYVFDVQESAAPHGMDVSYMPPRLLTGLDRRCPEYVELNAHLALAYLAPADWSLWSARHASPVRAGYIRRLLDGEVDNYEVAARFGPRPRYLDRETRPPTWRELLRVGVVPRTIQYGDPQDMGVDQYTVIVRRTEPCGFEPRGPGGVPGE